MTTAKALIFDFGGTLDINGVHWYELWKQAYEAAGLMVDEDIFEEAYFHAEEILNKAEALQVDYFSLLMLKVELQMRFIYGTEFDNATLLKIAEQKVAEHCLNTIIKGANKSFAVLRELQGKYKMAVVSNFYGNLDVLLKELNLFDFFQVIIDSKYEKFRKPDSRIYLLAAKKLDESPENCVFIGDSYVQDIEPSSLLGFQTIMIRNREDDWAAYPKADNIINSIEKLTDYLLQ